MQKSKAKSNKNRRFIYLDNASSAPVDNRVSSVMQKILKEFYANPSGIHDLSIKAKKILSSARKSIAEILKAHENEIIFTSGGTESNNLAILGLIENFKNSHIVTSNIEHSSVLELCKYLEKTKKAEVTYVRVEENGIVDLKKIKKALKKNTVLVSIMYANNEIGTIQPIKEIAKEIRHFNKLNNSKVLFHTDAVQAINYLPINIEKLGVDLFTFNGSKIYGPKGVGVLYKRRNIKLSPLIHGGEQEYGLRPGTENVSGIAGLSEALKIVEKIKDKENKRLIKLREYFVQKLNHSSVLRSFKILINGDLENRLPNNINITIPKISSDLLVIELGERGIYVSSKSACKAGDGKASHVIKALRKETSETDGAIRFSLGRVTEKKDLDFTVKSLEEILLKLKKWYI